MISKENIFTLEDVSLSNIDYAFFTNEDGHSEAGYLINGKKTRNVNLYSSELQPEKGFDPAKRVLANIQMCFQEVGGDVKHKFFMTSYGGKSPLVICCDNLRYLEELKAQASQNLYYEDEDKLNPKRLGLEPKMREAINNSDVSIIKANALIFKGIPGESIAVLGASGDAHPIMMFDDENKIACYIASTHIALSQGILEKSFDEMIKIGANKSKIQLVIGPGLGPRSYEFGEDAPEYFSIQENIEKVFKSVKDTKGNGKYLIDIKELVIARLRDRLASENIYNIELDTMGFDLYEEVAKEDGSSALERKTTVNFKELNENGPLFFGARRTIMQQSGDLMQHNSGAYSQVGRHGTGFCLKN